MKSLLLAALLFAPFARADVPAEARVHGGAGEIVQPEDPPVGGLRFLGLVQSRFTGTSVVPTNPFLDGQVVGLTGGLNGTAVAGDAVSLGAEYRTTGFFTYAPPLLDGAASLTAAFEIDLGFGDQSYGTGGNTGGGFGGDQVNLQTRRLHGTFRAVDTARDDVHAVLGLQFVADSVFDPQAATPDDLFRTGGGLRFFGSEASGLTLYGRHADRWGERARWRLGGYTLWERGVGQPDDVTLYLGDVRLVPERAVHVGGHVWYLRDRSGGQVGALGVGPTSALSQLQGGPRLDFRLDPEDPPPETDGDFLWVGLDAGYNHALRDGPFGVTGLVVMNVSGFYVLELPDDTGIGWLLQTEARYRYAAGDGSLLRAELLFASDDDADLAGYGSLVTGNSYGIVGAVWATHGALLLFPDPEAINRQSAIVYDVSNGGRGLVALTGSAGYDVVPGRAGLTAGFAHARDATGGLGTELNLRLRARPWTLVDVGVAGGAVVGSRFDHTPWTAFGYLQWVVL